MNQLPPSELARWLAGPPDQRPLLLDVREPWETEIARIPGSVEIPMGDVPDRIDAIEPGRPIVCICHHAFSRLFTST